jgi:glycosyltransferase involved in cell wall biosynthesis
MPSPGAPEVVWIRERFRHMGDHSGYDQLCETMLERGQVRARSYWRAENGRYDRRTYQLLQRFRSLAHGTPFYNESSAATELRAMKALIFRRRVAHVCYAENNLGLLRHFKGRAALVATVHQPKGWWTEPGAWSLPRRAIDGRDLKQFFERVDVLVTLSTANRDFLANETSGAAVFIPYGIDVDFFSPPPGELEAARSEAARPSCLVVGHWMRDFPLLEQVIEILSEESDEILFDLVIPPARIPRHVDRASIERLLRRPGVRHHHDLSDGELLDLYRSANLLLLPLKEASANSALLEAMATGLPIVSNGIDGVVDYADPSCAALTQTREPEEMSDAVSRILSSADSQRSMGAAARSRAVDNFSWERVAEDTLAVYEQVAP